MNGGPEKSTNVDPRKLVHQVVNLIVSPNFKGTLALLKKEDARYELDRLAQGLKRLEEINRESGEMARERLGLEPYDAANPQEAIARILREGRYLNFSRVDEDFMFLIPESMRTLLEVYRPEFTVWGRQSIANLCLSISLMKRLTNGVYVMRGNYREELVEDHDKVQIHQIDDLRRILEDPNLTICSVRPKKGGGYLFYSLGRSRNLLEDKLAEWNAIPEEAPSSPQM